MQTLVEGMQDQGVAWQLQTCAVAAECKQCQTTVVAQGMMPTFAGSIFDIGGVDGVPRLIQVFQGEVGHLLQTFNICQGNNHQITCSSTGTFQTWQASVQA